MIKYLKPLGQFVIRVTDKIDDLCVSCAKWASFSQIRLAVWVLFIFLVYNWIAAGVELLIWGETFQHFIDNIVIGCLGFIWLASALEIQDTVVKRNNLQLRAINELLFPSNKKDEPVSITTTVTTLREAIQQAEQFNLLRLRTNDGNYHVVTGALVDADGKIILTE